MFTLANVMRITNKIQEEKNVSHIGRVCVCVSVQRETMKTLKLWTIVPMCGSLAVDPPTIFCVMYMQNDQTIQ